MIDRVSQQEFLRQAMLDLGLLAQRGASLTRDEMCRRLGCPRATFDKWMLPSGSANAREMPATLWSHVREVVAHERLKAGSSVGAAPGSPGHESARACRVKAQWDACAGVWVATSDEVPGLVTEASSVEALHAKLRDLVPELLRANQRMLRGSDVQIELLLEGLAARGSH